MSTVYICYTTLAMNCCRVMFYVIMSSKGRTWFVVSFKPLMTHYMRHKLLRPPAVFASAYSFLFSKPFLCRPVQFSAKHCYCASFRENACKVGNFTLFLQLFWILQFDQTKTSRVWFCRRLPSFLSSKGALQLPFLQPFKGTTNLKRPKFAILS